MQVCIKTGQAWPDEVWEQLAQFTADCLSMDPKLRPSAEKGMELFTNLALSDWSEGIYTIEKEEQNKNIENTE